MYIIGVDLFLFLEILERLQAPLKASQNKLPKG